MVVIEAALLAEAIAVVLNAVAPIEEAVSTEEVVLIGVMFAETQVSPAAPAAPVPERLATSTTAALPEAIPSVASPASEAFMEAEVFTAAVAADRGDLL